jgi:hypothetical protein
MPLSKRSKRTPRTRCALARAAMLALSLLCLLGGGSREALASCISGEPCVTAVSPANGSSGTTVTITGTGFTGATGLAFGSTPTFFEAFGDSSIIATAPGGGGTVNVTVTAPTGLSATSAADQFTYPGPAPTEGLKLVGTGATGNNAHQGWSVALSADGTTLIVGGLFDNSGVGAAWVFTSSGGVWTQQAKLTPSDNSGTAEFGYSVALSADGNTAIIGGPDDNSFIGAAWVFTRSNGVWTQQGSKLVGSGGSGQSGQGVSVALSSDGNTAIVGGPTDNNSGVDFVGAAWVFTQSGGAWSQVGSKLVASDYSDQSEQGNSVALSGDGNTAIIGGPGDNQENGAAWVFTQSSGTWSQQGSKLTT